MSLDQIVNQKLERTLGAGLLRQIVLEAQLEEMSKQFADAEAARKEAAEAVERK